MTIRINGRKVELPDDVQTIHNLLNYYDLEDRIVIVEINQQITLKEQYSSLTLSDGDIVELIHFVGGG
ncbi:sulfur carrier protein ThiS [Peribacillus saganii]|uniref:Sulfur carrier protein ThiS n=1 Tax=Peribacillus saganii TaxID=2303992 RepID=A0A372LN55_9BACI|nr:sulfur carrier protein ThiS [Peribacillus saganii]RFU67518.1 sulfur carrier protein ThiS [Peribacillus saganii]